MYKMRTPSTYADSLNGAKLSEGPCLADRERPVRVQLGLVNEASAVVRL
jgi:hypothetical protein